MSNEMHSMYRPPLQPLKPYRGRLKAQTLDIKHVIQWIIPKNSFLQRTERRFKCANSQRESDKNLVFKKRHVTSDKQKIYIRRVFNVYKDKSGTRE